MRETTYLVSKSDFKEALKRGTNKVADVVGRTLGPFGRNVLLERKVYKTPFITNHGLRVARSLTFEDPVENMAAQILIEAAERTAHRAGDNTSATIVLAQAIINEAFERIGDTDNIGLQLKEGLGKGDKKINVIELRRKIHETKEKVLKQLEKNKIEIKGVEDLEKVAFTSVEDKKLAKIIAEIVHKIGDNGHVFVQHGYHYETETEVVEGMKFGGKLAGQYAINDNAMDSCILEDVDILVTNHEIKSIHDLAKPDGKFIGTDLQMQRNKNRLVIFAWKFGKVALQQFAQLRAFCTSTMLPYIFPDNCSAIILATLLCSFLVVKVLTYSYCARYASSSDSYLNFLSRINLATWNVA